MNTFGHFVSFVWADIVLCCFGLLCNVFVLILTLFRVFSHVKLFVHSEALLLKESADIFPFPRLLRLPCQCKIWGRTFCFRLRSRSCNFFFFFFFFLRVCCYGGLFSENACPAKDETSVRRNPKHKSHLLTLFATICNVPWHAKQSSEMCLSLDWRRVSRNFRSVYIRWCKNVVVIFWCSLDTACNCTAVLMQGLVPLTDTCPTLALQRAADFSPLLCFYIQRRFVFCTLGTALPCFNLWFPLDFVCT